MNYFSGLLGKAVRASEVWVGPFSWVGLILSPVWVTFNSPIWAFAHLLLPSNPILSVLRVSPISSSLWTLSEYPSPVNPASRLR